MVKSEKNKDLELMKIREELGKKWINLKAEPHDFSKFPDPHGVAADKIGNIDVT